MPIVTYKLLHSSSSESSYPVNDSVVCSSSGSDRLAGAGQGSMSAQDFTESKQRPRYLPGVQRTRKDQPAFSEFFLTRIPGGPRAWPPGCGAAALGPGMEGRGEPGIFEIEKTAAV